MKSKLYMFICLFCAVTISVAGCGKGSAMTEKPAAKDGTVLARIGDDVITLEEYNQRLSRLPDDIKAVAEKNKAVYLDNLVLETLLYKEALRRDLGKDKELKELFEEAKKRILIARLAKEEVEDKINISEKDLKGYYQEHKDNFVSPELVRASHILVKSLDEAADISDRLNAGAPFEELARQHSLDTTNKRGGDLGYFSAGQMVPEFEDACMRLKVGEISGPVKTEFGYHVIKMTDRREAKQLEFEEVRNKIESMLVSEKRRLFFDKLVTELKSKSDITINSELIEPQAVPAEEPNKAAESEG